MIELLGSFVFLDYLKVGVPGSVADPLSEKPSAYLPGESPPPEVFLHMDGIDSDIVPVQYSKASGDDTAVRPDTGGHGLAGNRTVHGRDDPAVKRVRHLFQPEKDTREMYQITV